MTSIPFAKPFPGEPTDETLMLWVQQGNRSAFETLYKRWKNPIFGFVRRRSGDLAAAEDANQETWLRLYRSRDRFQATRRFRPWLFAIAANAGCDARRPRPEVSPFKEPTDHVCGGTEARDLLVRALADLRPEDRQILILEGQGHDSAEIAGKYGIGTGAARVRLHRARTRFQQALEVHDS